VGDSPSRTSGGDGISNVSRSADWIRRSNTQHYFHGEKVAYGLLVQLVLEG
jgi:glycerol dehydrogenase-like iron-containing ADH family enzyme